MKMGIVTTATAGIAGLLLAATPGVAIAAPTTDELVRAETPSDAAPLDISAPEAATMRSGDEQASQATVSEGVSLELANATGDRSVSVSLSDVTPVDAKDADANKPIAEDASGSPIYAQQLNESQQRVITSIDDADDANTFSYDFDLGENQALAMTDDGIPFVYEQTGDEYHVVTMFSAPWAKDAEGDDLATSYSIEGNTVVQTVDVTDAAFPVIADPTWTVGGATAVIPSIRGGAADVYLNKKLSQDFVGGGATVCGVVVTILGMTGVGALFAGGLAIACTTAAGAATIGLNHGVCVVLTVRPGSKAVFTTAPYTGSRCK